MQQAAPRPTHMLRRADFIRYDAKAFARFLRARTGQARPGRPARAAPIFCARAAQSTPSASQQSPRRPPCAPVVCAPANRGGAAGQSLAYGGGGALEFDWLAVEQWVLEHVIEGVPLMQDGIRIFEFKGEVAPQQPPHQFCPESPAGPCPSHPGRSLTAGAAGRALGARERRGRDRAGAAAGRGGHGDPRAAAHAPQAPAPPGPPPGVHGLRALHGRRRQGAPRHLRPAHPPGPPFPPAAPRSLPARASRASLPARPPRQLDEVELADLYGLDGAPGAVMSSVRLRHLKVRRGPSPRHPRGRSLPLRGDSVL